MNNLMISVTAGCVAIG